MGYGDVLGPGRSMEMSQGVRGAEHGLFSDVGPLPCRIHPPPISCRAASLGTY